MKKEDLRPVMYDTVHPKKGYFHQWVTKKNDDGGDFVMALVETENGTIKEMHSSNIKFSD